MKALKTVTALIILSLCTAALHAEEKKLTIIHSNDLHSHFLGFAPNIDYTPDKTNDDSTMGGWARISTVISNVKKNRGDDVLIIDAGDFLMGSLFHMLCREESMELKLLGGMGYDVISLGNHEFDLKPKGLARILTSASLAGKMPAILLANAKFSASSDKDDTLEQLFAKGIVKPYTVIERSGLRIGLFGLMGKDAAEVAPFASPVTFADPIESAKAMVQALRSKEKVDVVIAVSHCGLRPDASKSEDRIMAKKVKGIDIIVSGHTHTRLPEPIIENGTIIVQSWEYGKNLGVLDLTFDKGRASVAKYEAVTIDDSIESDPVVMKRIRGFIDDINRRILKDNGLSFYQVIAETAFDMTLPEDESNLGNMVADSMRWYVNKVDSDPKDPSSRVVVAVESLGLLRDNVLKGKTGNIAVCDLFGAFPLGIGWDDTMCYPIVTFYLNAQEIKKALEVLTSIYPLKGSDYFLQLSGLKFTYNPHRVIFDRVTEIWMEDEKGDFQPLDYSSSNTRLYRLAANIYNSTFLKIIGGFTMNILNIVPKDKNGAPIDDLGKVIVDADPGKEGVQELKEWVGLMLFVKSFPDTDGDGTPNIPEQYRGKLGRVVTEASWNPVSLLSRGTWITWTVFTVILAVLALTGLVVYKVVNIVRRRATR